MRKLLFESLFRRPFTERAPSLDDAAVMELAIAVAHAARRRLGRSLSIREVDAGSCNGCELEIHALNNAYYDVERFGIRFVASPRHADVLMVTGPVTKNMREALERTYVAMPSPKWVVAVGACALMSWVICTVTSYGKVISNFPAIKARLCVARFGTMSHSMPSRYGRPGFQ